ncbi:MAG TPA: tripartite tricarboxylate transporter substrate binding protein [Burkholderiales bacterium]|nr:tripartite tricarboxylate transporter substrate binding protein [Burkholderiales bacterium]
MKFYAHCCISVSAALTLTFTVGGAWAQTYPIKPLRLIVSSSPQGGTDTIARIAAAQLSESLGQQVIVDNRPGANGQIAVAVLAKSPPDGYTLLMSGAASLVIHPHTYSKLPYDVARDLQPVSLMAASDYILAVHPSLPVKTVKDLIALAKAKPGQIAFASSGQSGIPHLAGELFKLRANVDMLHVPYKGGGPAALAILSGEVSLMFGTGPTVVPHAKTGRLRLIATASEKRSKTMPELPTVGETLPGVLVSAWYGMQVPTGTPKEIVARLSSEIAKAVTIDKVARAIVASGLEPVTNTPEQFAAYIREQTVTWGKVVKAARIPVE